MRIGNLRVVIYPNDHRPAHVHVIGPEHEALFHLNCPEGLIRIITALTKHVAELCAAWKEIHDNY